MKNPQLLDQIQEQVNIRTTPTIIKRVKNNIDEKESQLFSFFKLILMDPRKAKLFDFNEKEVIRINPNDSKLYVNYYDIIKSEVYVDLSLPIEEIISTIFGQIFYPNFVKKIYKRIKKNHTTQYIISNPIQKLNKEESLFNYDNFLYLEFGTNKLSTSSNLKEGDELSLKLSEDIFREITLPINGNITIQYKGQLLGQFPMSENGISYTEFKKLLNTNKYDNTTTLYGDLILDSLNFSPKCQIIGGLVNRMMFLDPSKATIKQIPLSEKAPKWRYISEGLNFFGICENEKCEAHKKKYEVIFKTLENGQSVPEEGLIFDMQEKRGEIKCPLCEYMFEPNTCGFYKCEYQFIGTKKEGGKPVEYNSEPKVANNNLEYYKPNKKKEKIQWLKLKIYVLPIQDIKYESPKKLPIS